MSQYQFEITVEAATEAEAEDKMIALEIPGNTWIKKIEAKKSAANPDDELLLSEKEKQMILMIRQFANTLAAFKGFPKS